MEVPTYEIKFFQVSKIAKQVDYGANTKAMSSTPREDEQFSSLVCQNKVPIFPKTCVLSCSWFLRGGVAYVF